MNLFTDIAKSAWQISVNLHWK